MAKAISIFDTVALDIVRTLEFVSFISFVFQSGKWCVFRETRKTFYLKRCICIGNQHG